MSAGLGRPPPSFCNILTAESISESMASTSPQPPRHWLRICIWSKLGRLSGPASSKAERSIRSCKAVSPPTRPVKTVRPSLMMAITSDADCVRSPPGGGSYYRVGGTAGWRLGGVGVAPHALIRPLPLRPGEGSCPPTAAEALSAADSSRDPPPPPRRIACERPPSRLGPASPLPLPLSRPPPRPRPRPRPATGAMSRPVPRGDDGASTAVCSARRATATAPLSTACAALTARAASSATRAASAVMASARVRARAT